MSTKSRHYLETKMSFDSINILRVFFHVVLKHDFLLRLQICYLHRPSIVLISQQLTLHSQFQYLCSHQTVILCFPPNKTAPSCSTYPPFVYRKDALIPINTQLFIIYTGIILQERVEIHINGLTVFNSLDIQPIPPTSVLNITIGSAPSCPFFPLGHSFPT